MTEGYARKITKFKPDELRVHFSPELKRDFARLEAAVCESEHFDSVILRVLQDLAEGKPTTVYGTILAIASLVQETGDYVRATGDTKTEELFYTIIDDMMPLKDRPEPITVVRNAVQQGRGG